MKRLSAMLVVMLSLLALVSCGTGGDYSLIPDDQGKGNPLSILATYPADGDTGVSVSTDVRVALSAKVDLSTVTNQTIQLSTASGSAVQGVVSIGSTLDTLIFTPQSALAYLTEYEARVASDLKDVNGNLPESENIIRFTTASDPETPPIPPQVLYVSPANGSSGVSIAAPIEVVFSKAMNPLSINNATFTVDIGGIVPVAGVISYADARQTAEFVPLLNWDYVTSYTVTVSQEIVDRDALPLGTDTVVTFTTEDITAPAVIAVSPADGATSVPVNRAIEIVLNKPMQAATINETTVLLKAGAIPVAGTVSYVAATQTARLVPNAPLASLTLYTATMKAGVADVDGQHLGGDYTFSFTTIDATPPTIASVSPVDGAGNVPINTAIEATFDEPMDASTITGGTFTLQHAGVPVAGTVSYLPATNTAVLTPSGNLTSFTDYTATVAASVTDRAGNPLGTAHTWNFTTSDVTAPTVTATLPVAGAVNVARTSTIQVTFSKEMNAATIDATSFLVQSSFGATLGAIAYDAPSRTATFTPNTALYGSTLYTVSLNTSIKDTAGNPLAGTFSFTFTTIAAIPTAISSSLYHSLAVLEDGTVMAWGRNQFSQLGDGTQTDRASPVRIPGLTGIVAVAAGEYHSIALADDGTIYGWGRNNYGQLGDGTLTDRVNPVTISGPSDFTAIAAGLYHSLALLSDGTVWAWGRNNYGQLGDGSTTTATLPQQIPTIANVTTIAAGSSHSLAIRSDTTAWAWGLNGNGQLGDNTTTQRNVPVQVNGLLGVTAIDGGNAHSVASLADGSAWSWGLNSNGQLGVGTTTQSLIPVQVHGVGNVDFLIDIAFVAAGISHTMFGASDGTIYTCGLNTNGQLGDETVTQRTAPVQVGTTANATALASHAYHSLALFSNGTISGWGYNYYGQVGNNGATFVGYSPHQVSGLPAVAAAAGGLTHVVIAGTDGSAWAWGINTNGQLGDNTAVSKSNPVQVRGVGGVGMLSDVVDVSAGASHSVARKTDNTVFAWGLNSSGQLGDNTTSQRNRPVQVHGVGNVGMLSNVSSVSSGAYHNLALLSDATLVAWGRNSNGQLGDATTTQRNTPVVVPGLSNVIAIAAGRVHSLALRSDGSVWAWGYNGSGQLGDATTTQQTSPVQVHGRANSGMLAGIVAIAAGDNHSMAVASDGSVYTWGSNAYGQLGDGTLNTRTTPVLVHAPGNVGYLTSIVAISGYDTTLALTSAGSVYAWGNGGYAQVGAFSSASPTLPVRVVGNDGSGFLSSVAALSTGGNFSLARSSGNAVFEWGWNTLNPMKDGTLSYVNAPASVTIP